ncbi:hypothetical protein [Catellatospora paridis]|uniref:hypothetical protein n=1 Tax=Catellatospora paridis TaxID=1617086 RepID=UPI0012D3D4A4|nr:hypothetical protein [Catellatospora paridis]
MAELDGLTIAALTLWTVWLIVWIAMSWGLGWSTAFVALCLLAWIASDVSWRGFLLAALATHLLVLAFVWDRPRKRIGRGVAAVATSASGVLWLAVTGGPRYWTPLLSVAAAAAVALSVHRLRLHRRLWLDVRWRVGRWRRASWSRQRQIGLGFPQSGLPNHPLSPIDSRPADRPVRRPESGRPPVTTLVDVDTLWVATPRVASTAGIGPAHDQARPRATTDLFFAVPQLCPAAGKPEAPHFAQVSDAPQQDGLCSATLTVVARPAGTVRVSGLAWFPPELVRIRRSGTVVAGDHGVIQLKRVIRLRRFELSVDTLVAEAGAAMAHFLNGGSVAYFQRSLRSSADLGNPGDAEANREIKATHEVDVRRCRYVHMGDDNRTGIDQTVMLERSILPLHDLLIRDADLCRLLREALLEDQPGQATAAFLRRTLTVLRQTDDHILIRGARMFEAGDARLFELFSTARVSDADLVVVGSGNELRNDTRLRRPGFDAKQLRRAVDPLRPERTEMTTWTQQNPRPQPPNAAGGHGLTGGW